MKRSIQRILHKFGYEIEKLPPTGGRGAIDPAAEIQLTSGPVVDVEQLARLARTVPGMITPKAGQFLFTMCYLQEAQGDVVEVGSWQGRSTSFLARAVKSSGNGRFYAIDHFRGNVGKEHHYAVGSPDLVDLEENFLNNMKRLGLLESVTLLNMPNVEAEKRIRDIRIRFLFIDGDHTKEGVEKDIELFFPKLVDGAIVVFDDFSEKRPGLLAAIDALLAKRSFARIMSYQNGLVLQCGT